VQGTDATHLGHSSGRREELEVRTARYEGPELVIGHLESSTSVILLAGCQQHRRSQVLCCCCWATRLQVRRPVARSGSGDAAAIPPPSVSHAVRWRAAAAAAAELGGGRREPPAFCILASIHVGRGSFPRIGPPSRTRGLHRSKIPSSIASTSEALRRCWQHTQRREDTPPLAGWQAAWPCWGWFG
jgi:hypothetical protein